MHARTLVVRDAAHGQQTHGVFRVLGLDGAHLRGFVGSGSSFMCSGARVMGLGVRFIGFGARFMGLWIWVLTVHTKLTHSYWLCMRLGRWSVLIM